MLVKSEKKLEESGEIRSNERFQQSDKLEMAKSQLTTLLWFLWLWYTSRKSSSNTEVGLQIILAEWKLKVWSFSQQRLAMADQETNKSGKY